MAGPVALSAARVHAEPQSAPPPLEGDAAAGGVPAGWRDPAAGKETWSGGMIASGIVLISIAGTLLPIGTGVAVSGGQNCGGNSSGAFTCVPDGSRVTGLGMLIGAAGALAIGIPLVVFGAQKVPIEIPRRAAVIVGPASAMLRVDF